MLYGIPQWTVAHYIEISSEFFIAQKKHKSVNEDCKRLDIWNTKKDPREKYYMSPYYNLGDTGFVIPENMWPNLAIDELDLCWDVHTILSNPDKDKIVACIPWIKAKFITESIWNKIPFADRLEVKEITLDMSNAMDWIARGLFPQSKRTLDRFHVTWNVLEDIQAIRIRIKTIIKDEELKIEDQCKIDRKKYIPKKLENDESRLDFVKRLHYQIFKRRKDWNEFQIKRWETLKLHDEFYDVKIGYEILEKFYEIYDKEISRVKAKVLWNNWLKRISGHEQIIELQNVGRTISNHLEWILNYFDNRSTNAFAEWLHSRIRRMISNVRWFKNKHYMLYRIKKIFA